MQDPKEIEAHYNTPDPWAYKTNPADLDRKNRILNKLKLNFGTFDRALDLGCGEGWLTTDLPALNIEGYELSAQARGRLPFNVRPITEPWGSYDLVIATGVMYAHYDYKHLLELIRIHASGRVLTCNIKAWEVKELKDPAFMLHHCGLEQTSEQVFPYREYEQQLRIFRRVR